MNWKMKFLYALTLGIDITFLCLLVYAVQTTGIQNEKIPAASMGWVTLFSEPQRITNPDAPHGHDNISLMQFEFITERCTVLTGFINAGSIAGMEMPDCRKGGNWKIGDEVFIAWVPVRTRGERGGLYAEAYFAIDYRKKP